MIRIFRGDADYIIESGGRQCQTNAFSLDELFRAPDPHGWLRDKWEEWPETTTSVDLAQTWRPPVESQEIWAAGVTYYRSRTERMREAEDAGGDVFYDRVYEAARPELFWKANARRARGHGEFIRTRSDSSWDVPEPELTLAISSAGEVFGYSIGNDVSSRSIEGENPLYLPQAKVYKGSCALGPCLAVGAPPPPESRIHCQIERDGQTVYSDETSISQIKRTFDELAHYLFLENDFPDGALLMTGTGIVPSQDFTLQRGDVVTITIDGIGTLTNKVQ